MTITLQYAPDLPPVAYPPPYPERLHSDCAVTVSACAGRVLTLLEVPSCEN